MMTAEKKQQRLAAGRRALVVQHERAREKRLQEAVFRDMLIAHIVRLQGSATSARTLADSLVEHDPGRHVLECVAFERELAADSVRHILLLTAPEIIVGKAV